MIPPEGGAAIVGAALLALAARLRLGSRQRSYEDFITTLSGDEVFGHVTRPSAATAILRQGFRESLGRFGRGVYLLPPETDWGPGLPPSTTPAHAFRLKWHPNEDLRVLRVTLPEGSRLLRVSGPDVAMGAFKLLEDLAAYRDAIGQRPSWEDSDESNSAVLRSLLDRHGIDGLYIHDFTFNQGEVLLVNPGKAKVVREQFHQGQ